MQKHQHGAPVSTQISFLDCIDLSTPDIQQSFSLKNRYFSWFEADYVEVSSTKPLWKLKFELPGKGQGRGLEMDHFFQQQLLQGDVFCYENGPVNQSAFVPYICRPWGGREVGVGSSSMEVHPTNMSRRMIEFMRRSFTVKIETQEPDSKRCYRHKMSERLRRQRERNGYLALHSLLPHDTKKDKNSIMLMAAKKIQELEMYKEMLKGRNDEIEERLAASGIRNVESTKIRIKVVNPTSGVDPMIDVLKCLKSLGTKTRSIQSQFSNQELVAVMEIESEIEAAEIENAVKRTLA
uniref:Basic helix-loop-helix family protein n=2 Tax=Populus TaxID=3689 RepID=A0A4U5NLJ5_POPAL|nr:basic helix-loop-helix family protein [Populus alba]